jgi:hypothetical protein
MPFRTAQEFDAWFRRSPDGDPWGYNNAADRARLDAELEFIVRRVGPEFRGTFIELAAFNGVFTRRLATAFPEARIAASDFAPFAVDMGRNATAAFPNVRFDCIDIARFEKPAGVVPPVVVLLMECIYFLPEAARMSALERIVRTLGGGPDIFISCPIRGIDPYPSEHGLIETFSRLGYRKRGLRVLNCRKFRRAAVLNHAVPALAFLPPLRRRLANQVIYCFSPVG